MLFALIREVSATPILLILLVAGKRRRNRARAESGKIVEASSRYAWKRIVLRLLPGLFIFIDQLCSLTGVTLADGATGSAWQPSQVVFTLIISVLLGMESLTRWKVLSMAMTVAGALCLVFLGGSESARGASSVAANATLAQTALVTDAEPTKDYYLLGNLFFFLNCMASSLEVIVWRKLLSSEGEEGSELAVMAESYLIAAVFMVVANVVVSFFPSVLTVVCPKCHGDPWHVPSSALYAICYSVIFQTVVAYVAQAWALKRAPASLAALYATAQPIMAALVTCLFLLVGFNPKGSDGKGILHYPGIENLGAVFIIAGLVVAEYGRLKTKDKDSPTACCADVNSDAGNSSAWSSEDTETNRTE